MTWARLNDESTLPRCLRNWFNPRNAALFVARLLIGTSLRVDWKPRKHIPRRKIRRVLYQTERYLATGRDKHLDDALKCWGTIPKEQRQRQFVGAVGDLVFVARRISGRRSYLHPADDPWEHLKAAATQVQLDKDLVNRIEMRVRLRDFTRGKEKAINDEDVWLACAAACDIDNYEVARDIALRALGE